jgi:phage baseplate assembly protein gpV
MSGRDPIGQEGAAQLLRGLDDTAAAPALTGIVVGELVGIANEGGTPLVLFPGQAGTAALAARTVVDLHAPHIGGQVVLMFDGGDPSMPVIMGVLRGRAGWPLDAQPGHVQADVDGARLIVSAHDELVLRCGKASITLTRDGKVTIRGTHVFSRSSGVNRVKGGSVQLN